MCLESSVGAQAALLLLRQTPHGSDFWQIFHCSVGLCMVQKLSFLRKVSVGIIARDTPGWRNVNTGNGSDKIPVQVQVVCIQSVRKRSKHCVIQSTKLPPGQCFKSLTHSSVTTIHTTVLPDVKATEHRAPSAPLQGAAEQHLLVTAFFR